MKEKSYYMAEEILLYKDGELILLCQECHHHYFPELELWEAGPVLDRWHCDLCGE